ncbi:NFACT family protein, partial [uncultured Oribacterium sp.]
MAFDGLYLAACIAEFQERILGGKISKIIQSEKDELQLFIKKEKNTEILHLSA